MNLSHILFLSKLHQNLNFFAPNTFLKNLKWKYKFRFYANDQLSLIRSKDIIIFLKFWIVELYAALLSIFQSFCLFVSLSTGRLPYYLRIASLIFCKNNVENVYFFSGDPVIYPLLHAVQVGSRLPRPLQSLPGTICPLSLYQNHGSAILSSLMKHFVATLPSFLLVWTISVYMRTLSCLY